MKFIILALLIALVAAGSNTGYIYNYIQNGSIKPNASQDSYTQNSLTDLLKHNFQVGSNLSEMVQEFGKGNLLNPVQLNYLFVIEGSDKSYVQDKTRVQIEEQQNGEKLLDSIFNAADEFSLVRLTQAFFPKEKRVPFYYYKSQAVQSTSAYEKVFGIEMQRDSSNNEFFLFDNLSKKQIGRKFSLQTCFAQNFKEYSLLQDKIIKNSSDLSLEITAENAKEVDILLKDLCAVSKLSQMFKHSQQPDFVAFVLNTESLENNELVQELIKTALKNAEFNFEKSMGAQNTFGEVLIVDDVSEIETYKPQGIVAPRILLETAPEASEHVAELTDGETLPDYSMRQFQAWFSLVFALTLLFVIYGLFTMDIQRDTLLYAKFIAGDAR